MAKPLSEIENAENLRAHWVGWILQRVFRVVLFGFIGAAALGAFGNGLLSRVEHSLDSEFRILSENVGRVHAETTVELECQSVKPGQQLPIVIPYTLLDYYDLEDVWPEPLSQVSAKAGIRYEFVRQPFSKIVLTFRPRKPGRVESEIGIGTETFLFSQTILP